MRVSFGKVNGKEWDTYCQKVLRLKYETEDYVQIPSKFGGDLGLESFTKAGRAFQCYCPDDELTSSELYTKQRDKITQDIRKFINNENDLIAIVGATKIGRWYLVTPRFENKELIAHCERKAAEVRQRNCSHVDRDFRILILTEDDFVLQQQMLTTTGFHKVAVEPSEVEVQAIIDWSNSNNELFQNIFSKVSKIPGVKNIDQYVDLNIKNYLAGQDMLEKLRQGHPILHERLLAIKSSQEHKVKLFSQTPTQPPGEYLRECFDDYQHSVTEGLGSSISPATITHLAAEAVADWLARCPLDF